MRAGRWGLFLALGLLGYAAPTVCGAESFVFHLRNGDRVTGTVVSEDPQQVTLASALLGKVVLAVAEIERREKLPASPAGAPSTPSDAAVAAAVQRAATADTSLAASGLSASQQRRLGELVEMYRREKVTPGEYQERRARILAEPEEKIGAATAVVAAPTQPTVPAGGVTAVPKSSPPANVASVPAASPAAQPVQEAKPSFGQRLRKNTHGNVQIGMDLGFGTKERQLYSGRFQATYAEKRLRNALDYRVAYGETDGVLSANEMDGSMKLDVDLGQQRRFYVYDAAGAGYNEVRKIDLSYQEGIGFGYKLLTGTNLVVNLESGGQFQEYQYSNRTTRRVVSVRFGQEATWRIHQKLLLTQKAQFVPNVDDFDDYRLRLEGRLTYPLLKNLTLNLNVIDLYDSRPAPGIQPNDLQVQSTVGINF